MIYKEKDNLYFINTNDPKSILSYPSCITIINNVLNRLGDKSDDTLICFVMIPRASEEIVEVAQNKDSNGNVFKNKVLIWIGDETSYIPSDRIMNEYNLCLKNYIKEEYPEKRIFSLPMIIPSNVPQLPIIPIEKRKTNVFFSGMMCSNRFNVYMYLNKHKTLSDFILKLYLGRSGWVRLWQLFNKNKPKDLSYAYSDSIIRFNPLYANGYSPDEYANLLSNSKIGLSLKGYVTIECYKIYEFMRQGCVVVTGVLPNVPFYKDIPVIQVRTPEEMDSEIKSLLLNPNKMEEISYQASNYYQRYFSVEGISDYVYNVISKHIG